MWCEYKHSLGVPGEFPHTHVFGIAIFDLFLSVLAAIMIALTLDASIMLSIIIVLILGVIAHWAFCVPTVVNTALGLV